MQELRISQTRMTATRSSQPPEDFSQVRESLEKEGIKMAEAELTMIPQNYVDIDDPEVVKKFTRIIDMLEEDDDVQAVYHNANLPEEDDED